MTIIQDNDCCRAKILFVPLTFSGGKDAIINHLQQEQFSVEIHEPGQTRSAARGTIDVIVPDCRGSGFDPEFDSALLDRLRQEHPESVFMFLTDISVTPQLRQRMKKYGSVSATGSHTELLTIRLNRLLENLALADECGERLKTMLSISNSAADKSGLKTSAKQISVLVAGHPSPLSLRAMKSLQKHNASISAAMTIPQTLNYVENHNFDCLVLLPGTKTASHVSLIKLLRRNGRSKSLPILILTDEDNIDHGKTAERFLRQGADLILNDQDTEQQLAQEVSAFSRRNRLTKSMKQFLRKSITAGENRKKFACSVPFFESHMARQCASAQRSGKPLCLTAYRIRTQSGQPLSEHMQTQVLSYVDLIVQDIDLVTAAQQDIILISHPFTPISEAESLKDRIVSVLQDISFRSERQATFKDRVVIAANAEICSPDESPEEFITRALKGMAEHMPAPAQAKMKKPHLSLVQ